MAKCTSPREGNWANLYATLRLLGRGYGQPYGYVPGRRSCKSPHPPLPNPQQGGADENQ